MRPRSKTPRGVLQVDWAFFGELCRVLALKVFREYDPEVVIGIAKAGVIPGAVVASILQRDFASIAITPEGSVIAGPPRLVTGKRVLLVDETCDSGETMRLAKGAVVNGGASEVRTAVAFKTGTYEPDYHALATESTIVLPWDREVLFEGELVPNPLYRETRG